MPNISVRALGIASGLVALGSLAAMFATTNKKTTHEGDYVRFHQVKVPHASQAGDTYIVSGGAYCAPKRAPKDCVDEVVRHISATMNAHAHAKFTDVVPNILNLKEGNIRSFTELKTMVQQAKDKGIAADKIPTDYTLDAVYQGKGYIYPTTGYSRQYCPNGFGGGCPTGREF